VKNKKSLFRRIFSNTLLILNVFAVIWLLICYAASRVDPAIIKHLSLFSLTTPFALLANFIFLILWLVSDKKWPVLLSFLAVLYCYKMIPAIFGLNYFKKNDWTATPESFKIMSWNVHSMGTFNHPYEKMYAEGIIDLIGKEKPDILCLPEFAVNARPSRRFTPRIITQNNYKEYYFQQDNGIGRSIMIGTAIFSKYPITFFKAYELTPDIFVLQCNLQLNKTTNVSLYVVHLQSFGLSDRDKQYIEEVKQRSTEDYQKGRSFIWKFNQAYQIRGEEADKVAEIVARDKQPKIICGDFNDLPYSYTYSTIRGPLTDAFVQQGKGFGRTYNQIIPTLRIDHLFYSAEYFKLKAFKTVYSPLSDHSPVIARLEFMPSGKQ
jgi:endonuclease/exonuclease/phosphatase family metal-dependent hydrolase